jgi:hypothetical protein
MLKIDAVNALKRNSSKKITMKRKKPRNGTSTSLHKKREKTTSNDTNLGRLVASLKPHNP